MQIDLPECCSYALDEEKGPYIYFVKGDKRVILPGVYPLDQSNYDFWKKYFDCLNGDLVDYVEYDTLIDLIQRYRASYEFANLRSNTSQKKYNLYLRLMEKKLESAVSSRLRRLI